MEGDRVAETKRMDGSREGEVVTEAEITIDAEGRVYSFGTPRQMLDILLAIEPGNPRLRALRDQVQLQEAGPATSDARAE